nr:hypothetical protein [Tanacetum cinerariifolium]
MQTQTSNTLHNAIMEAGSKDRPPMLAPDWKDTEVPIYKGSPITTTERIHETYKNVSQEKRDQLNAEVEAKAIERLKQGESINVQDLETNLYWEFGKFTSQDGESLESYYSRFYKMMNELIRNQCNVTNHQVNVQFLLQLQPEWQRHVARECKKLKRVKDVAYHKEKMLLCKQEEAGIQLNAEQADWRYDTDDDELEDQELEVHYMYMAQLQEVFPDATDFGPIFDDEPLQKIAIIDSLDMNYNKEEIDQNDDDNDLAKERELIASLIEKLKCEIDESKNRNKFLETSNRVLIEKLKEAELARRNSKEYALQMELDCAKDLKAQLQDKGIVISELKKLIENLKGKSVDTKFEKLSVIRQPNAFKSQRPSVLGKPTTFSNSFVRKDFSKSKAVTQTNVSNDFSKPVTTQTLPPNKKSILKNMNVLAPGMHKLHTYHNQTRTSQLPQDSRKTNKRVSFSTRIIPTTSVSRQQLKSNPMGDRVMGNNSQGKNQEKSGIQCYNCKEYGHIARECQKPKMAKDAAYHREKMLLCKQEKAGIQLNAEQADWKCSSDESLVMPLEGVHIDDTLQFVEEPVERSND